MVLFKRLNASRSHILRLLLRFAASLLMILIVTLLLKTLRSQLSIQVISLLYLLPVILMTVYGGLTVGVLTCFVAFLSFNYFFIQPFHTLEVHQTQDLLTLIVFLVVAVVISQLIGQARKGVRLARSREWEAARLYAFISALAGAQDAAAIAQVLARELMETFHPAGLVVQINAQPGEPPVCCELPDGPHPASPSLHFPLRTLRGVEGEVRLSQQGKALTQQESRILLTSLDQAALAVERLRLAHTESKAHVLEESDRLKSALLNSVSHELRSPLAAIKASVSSLRSSTVDWSAPARDELLATIEEETDHLNALVGNLLDMSRIEAGALQPRIRWTAISEIASGSTLKMRKKLQDHTLLMDFPDSLPLVPVDYVMLEQVFTNLISNSAKYAPAGSLINLWAYRQDDWLHVCVANQGPPVPDAHLTRIFDKFHRITEADRVTGTGLGLSICKGIIEAHGGRIWAENEPGRFVFHFTLPLTLNGALPETVNENSDE